MSTQTIIDIATAAAARLNLAVGRDRVWRGRCPACGYGKPTLELKVEDDRIAISCAACGAPTAITAVLGLPPDLIAHPKPKASNIARAVNAWGKALPVVGTLVETYLRSRGITLPVPACIHFIPRQRNWVDGGSYPAMISLVARVAGDDEALPAESGLLPSGAHFTFLRGGDSDGAVRKAETECCKLTLGQLRHGGVWLTPIEEIGAALAVAEGIETALSVQQITGLPTVAALSAAGMQAMRWPQQVRRLWIAADHDPVGLRAAHKLLARAIAARLDVSIKVPVKGFKDFNDVLRGIR
jgi:putative DNA primase/helicase